MSDLEQPQGSPGDRPAEERGQDPITGMLQRALGDAPAPEHSLLPGIQRRIAIQSRGRYFSQRRATMRNPSLLLLAAALLILALAAAVFVALVPLMGNSEGADHPTPRDTSSRPPAP